jgi:hypothetical protein
VPRLARGQFYVHNADAEITSPVKIFAPLSLSRHPSSPLDEASVLDKARQSRSRLTNDRSSWTEIPADRFVKDGTDDHFPSGVRGGRRSRATSVTASGPDRELARSRPDDTHESIIEGAFYLLKRPGRLDVPRPVEDSRQSDESATKSLGGFTIYGIMLAWCWSRLQASGSSMWF